MAAEGSPHYSKGIFDLTYPAPGRIGNSRTSLAISASFEPRSRISPSSSLLVGLRSCDGPCDASGRPTWQFASLLQVDISKVDTAKISDSYFGKAKAKKSKKKGEEVFAEETPKAELSAEAISTQKAVDAALKVAPMVSKYLKTRFSLSNGDVPHKMCF